MGRFADRDVQALAKKLEVLRRSLAPEERQLLDMLLVRAAQEQDENFESQNVNGYSKLLATIRIMTSRSPSEGG